MNDPDPTPGASSEGTPAANPAATRRPGASVGIARNSMWLTVDTVASMVGAFYCSILVARRLGPDFMGQYNYVLYFATVLKMVTDLAIPVTVRKFSAEFIGREDFDAVRTLVDRSLAHRLREIPRVDAIVDEECGKLMAWTRGQGATSVVRDLAERFERVRAEEVRRNLKHFHPEEEAYINRMTKTLINRLLRPPVTQLMSGMLSPTVESARLELLRELFALDHTTHSGGGGRGTP